MKCPKCNCVNVRKEGRGHYGIQQYRCKECKHFFSEDTINKCKTLIFDIETAPIQALVWRVWKENISIDQVESDWFMLCWSAKWLNDNVVMGERLTSKEALQENDKRIVKKLWHLFDEADVIVAHNGDYFDIPKSRSRFLMHGLKPPSPFATVDTLKVAQRQFGFSHNKLDFLAKMLGLDRKMDTNFKLWSRCLKGEDKALAYMFKYNKLDVFILEEVYYKLQPWIKSHPNMNNFQSESGCSTCGSLNVSPKGFYTTQCNKYRTWVCKDCGAYSREARKTKVSVAR